MFARLAGPREPAGLSFAFLNFILFYDKSMAVLSWSRVELVFLKKLKKVWKYECVALRTQLGHFVREPRLSAMAMDVPIKLKTMWLELSSECNSAVPPA